MEVELALTIQKTQAKLEKYKKENIIVKQIISELEAGKDAI